MMAIVRKSGGRILQVYQDVNMSQSFDGLEKVCRGDKRSLYDLKEGEYLVFFNTKRTYLKIAAAHGVLAARRIVRGRFFDLTCITAVVRAFHNTGEIQYERALRNKLETLLARKGHARPIEED